MTNRQARRARPRGICPGLAIAAALAAATLASPPISRAEPIVEALVEARETFVPFAPPLTLQRVTGTPVIDSNRQFWAQLLDDSGWANDARDADDALEGAVRLAIDDVLAPTRGQPAE